MGEIGKENNGHGFKRYIIFVIVFTQRDKVGLNALQNAKNSVHPRFARLRLISSGDGIRMGQGGARRLWCL